MRVLKLFVFVMSAAVSHVLWAQSTPVPMLENTASQIISSLKQNKANLKQNHQLIYQTVQRYLLPNVDVSGMSRSVLGRDAWNKASTADRQEFEQVFTQLIIRTYATPLAEYTDETVKFLPVRGPIDGHFVRVNSVIIRSNGQNIPLSYSLVSKNNSWKIYDLSVEGVSLLQSFHSQFSQILQNSSMKNLIAEMRNNNSKAA